MFTCPITQNDIIFNSWLINLNKHLKRFRYIQRLAAMIRSLLTLLNNTSDEIRSTFVAVLLSVESGVRGDGAPELAEPMLQVLGVISRAALDALSYPRLSEQAELTL